MHSRHAGIEHAPHSVTGLNQLHPYIYLQETTAFILWMLFHLGITRIPVS